MRKLKTTAYLTALILAVGPILGCGALNPYKKNSRGYYAQHYYACGPIALEKAINALYTKKGVKFIKNPAPRRVVSEQIQDMNSCSKKLIAYFNRNAVRVTWPSEIKKIVDLYGFDIITIDDLDSLDPKKDIAIVLIHGKLLSKQYHWVVYPIDDVRNFYEKKTVIDTVYLLKWKGE